MFRTSSALNSAPTHNKSRDGDPSRLRRHRYFAFSARYGAFPHQTISCSSSRILRFQPCGQPAFLHSERIPPFICAYENPDASQRRGSNYRPFCFPQFLFRLCFFASFLGEQLFGRAEIGDVVRFIRRIRQFCINRFPQFDHSALYILIRL